MRSNSSMHRTTTRMWHTTRSRFLSSLRICKWCNCLFQAISINFQKKIFFRPLAPKNYLFCLFWRPAFALVFKACVRDGSSMKQTILQVLVMQQHTPSKQCINTRLQNKQKNRFLRISFSSSKCFWLVKQKISTPWRCPKIRRKKVWKNFRNF